MRRCVKRAATLLQIISLTLRVIRTVPTRSTLIRIPNLTRSRMTHTTLCSLRIRRQLLPA